MYLLIAIYVYVKYLLCANFLYGTARSLLEFLFLEISYTSFDSTRIDLFLDRHKKRLLNRLNISHVIGKTLIHRKYNRKKIIHNLIHDYWLFLLLQKVSEICSFIFGDRHKEGFIIILK